VERAVAPRHAEIETVRRRVEKRIDPEPWSRAQAGDGLRERDGLRTHEDSSAQLAFDDGSRLLVTETSLVFLRELRRSVTGSRRQSIEVVEGQADVEARQAARRSPQIEILVGEARTRPQPTAGPTQARARLAEAGRAEVMVYRGRSEVEAGGARVAVKEGQGTRVEPGRPPAPPERLLPAPRPLAPAAGSRWDFANPPFAWRDVPSAVRYVVEVCADAACAQLVERATGLAVSSWTPEALPRGELHWRVTAVSASGLDGFPAPAVPFAVDSDRADREGPAVSVVVVGPGRVEDDGRVRLGDGGRLRLLEEDDLSGVRSISYRWDGGPWREHDGALLAPPGQVGRLEFRAVDRLGRESRTWAVEVEVVSGPPEPPRLRPRSGP
jgi:hypothetical protein